MKLSLLLATISTASGFAPSQLSGSKIARHAATLEAPEAKTEAPAVAAEPVTADMNVEKDWPTKEFVKDSDRVMP
jgi:hypothetical protein